MKHTEYTINGNIYYAFSPYQAFICYNYDMIKKGKGILLSVHVLDEHGSTFKISLTNEEN